MVSDLPEGSIVLSTVTIIRFLNAEGDESITVDPSSGIGDLEVLGLLTHAQLRVIDVGFDLDEG